MRYVEFMAKDNVPFHTVGFPCTLFGVNEGEPEGKRWKIVDQMSANGTFVNNKRSSVSYLASGDRLRFGPVDCIFWMPAGASAGAGAGKLRWVVLGLAVLTVVALGALAYLKFKVAR